MEVIAGTKSTPGLQTLPGTTSARSCGVSPTATNFTCSCRPAVPWRAGRSPVSSRKAGATRTSGRPQRRDCSSTSMKAASPPPPWIRRRAGSSPGRRTWRWRWWRLNFRGWTPGRPHAACGQSGSGADSRARDAGAARQIRRRRRATQAGENRKQVRAAFALTEPIPFAGWRPECSPARFAWPSGRTARSRCCKWTSAGVSSPTWVSPTS